MRNTTEQNITELALERYATADTPRMRKILGALVKHLHAFTREVEPTEAEWMAGIDFLTRIGKTCTDKRQEFILFSDVLGVSMLVDAINHRLPSGVTPSTVQGPFHILNSPSMDKGGNMAEKVAGEPLVMHGQVRSMTGKPLPGATLDMWQPDAEGLYESQLDDHEGPYLRGLYTADKSGEYMMRTIAPLGYSIPMDGPVGEMLKHTRISHYRPTHIHFKASAPGHTPVTAHVFKNGDQYIENDVVFGVKDGLVVDFVRNQPGVAPNGERFSVPFYTVKYDIILKPAA